MERAQLEGVKKAAILKQATDFFNNAGSRHLNSQYKTELGDGKSKPRLRESASPFTRREPFNSSNVKRARITSAVHELRSNGCDFGCAKDLVISKENINKSLNFVRKNIHFMTKVKTKTGLIQAHMDKERLRIKKEKEVHDSLAIVKAPNCGTMSELKGKESEVLFKPMEEEYDMDDAVSFGDIEALLPKFKDVEPPKQRANKENMAPKRRLKLK